MNVRALFFLVVFGSFLIGCGGGSPKPVSPAVSPLAGNWLLVGPMPTNLLQLSPVSGFRLAMTFDVTGNSLKAAGVSNQPCNNQDPSSPIVLVGVSSTDITEGAIDADGSFTLQTPANFRGNLLSVQGKVPEAGGGWTGSYTASFTGPVEPPCGGTYSGTVTATSFPLVSGVYVGAGSSPSVPGAPGKPVTFQVSLQQGGIVTNSSTGISTPSSSVLTGSIQVSGSSCLSSGTIGPTPPGSVEGNLMTANFAMNDGSSLNFQGALKDSTEETITSLFVVVTGGKCAGFYQLPEIDRQQ
ncbi:hypothetical protein [Tunturiibacter lichenicola]|uniref:hypothetical protein n=1 Tax=Tunturiibacter lichenicola TaxID=2051959 RepID=UPI003D9AC5B8